MLDTTEAVLLNFGISAEIAKFVTRIVVFVIIIFLSIIGNYIAKKWILRSINKLIIRSKFQWDDVLLEAKVLDRLAHFAPALILYLLLPIPLEKYDTAVQFVTSLIVIYMIFLTVRVLDALLNTITQIYQSFDASKEIPIKSFTQILKIIIYFVGVVLIVAIVLDKSPVYLLSGLGALTAVLLLVFKDVILGFVAGVQLMANKMVARGDWIEMPKHGADGDVLDVTLTTVKVQNWDKTISTIPTYHLISESFKNWRGMSESDGRRIKRAINIDMQSIKFLDGSLLRRLKTISYLSDYLEQKQNEISQHNLERNIDTASMLNGRNLTNIGTFRVYVQEYLKNHPMINQNMTLLVRQLEPGETGLPIEIYVFCTDKNWNNYESIQADIFDHLLAAIDEFDLKIFQTPSGNDVKQLLAQQVI